MDVDLLTLNEVIEIIKKTDDDYISIILREKNVSFMFDNGISMNDIKRFIKTLEETDYVEGPIADNNPNRKHPLWVFKKYGFGCRCYIKIKVINKGKETIVVNFHEDETNKRY